MPDSSEVKKEGAVAEEAPKSTTASEQFVVVAPTMWHFSRGDLVSADQLPQEPAVYLKDGALKRATAADLKRGYALPEDLPEYTKGQQLAISQEAYDHINSIGEAAPAEDDK